MPRNMSFALTTNQFRDRSKTVTRRLGWKNLRPGQIINACVKCMGLKPGEKLQRLGQIEIVDVRREPLSAITQDDCDREGFPEMTPCEFVEMFCEHMKVNPSEEVTRIEFKHIEEDS